MGAVNQGLRYKYSEAGDGWNKLQATSSIKVYNYCIALVTLQSANETICCVLTMVADYPIAGFGNPFLLCA